MKRRSYRVTALREGRWWLLRVPELDIVTQTRRLARAEQTARDLIATWLHEDPASFDIEVVPAVGDEAIDRLIGDAVEARASAARQSSRATQLTDQAVHELVAKGVPMRDVGEMLGISHQRVAQLTWRSLPADEAEDLVLATADKYARTRRDARAAHAQGRVTRLEDLA